MSGYFSEEAKPVTWRGLKAVYTTAERAIMRELPVREQAVIHLLKAFMDGEIADAGPGVIPIRLSANHGAVRPADEATVGDNAASASRLGSNDPSGTSGLTVYIDAEDIPFGDPAPIPRKRPIYALVWTWKQNRVHKTKKRCQEKQRAWKKWYERQGWKVTNHPVGYFATSPQGERHSISLHEYDPESKERLK